MITIIKHNRELPQHQHSIPCRYSNVGGGGGVYYFCPDGPVLQVSRSAQKLLPLPKVSLTPPTGSVYSFLTLFFHFVFILRYFLLLSFTKCLDKGQDF